jgi:hypothetical protein
MIRIGLAIIVVACAAFMFFHHARRTGNLIGTTDLSAYQWAQTNGGSGSIKLEGDVVRCDILALPNLTEPNKSIVQLFQHKAALEQNRWYTIHFKARADHFLKLRIAAGMAKKPFYDLGLSQVITVSPEWSDYDYHFKAVRTDGDIDNAPLFDLSYETGTLWFKDLKMEAEE